MQFRHLEYFVQAVECKSLNRAARRLDVSPQTLCAGVASLEKELGYALLHRSPSGVSPTQNGETVYSDAVRMVEAARGWRALARPREERETVIVKLGASTTLMRWLVPQAVLSVKKEYPHIAFDLYESFVEQVFRTVVDKRMLGLITCVNERVDSSYRIQLLHNDMEFAAGPEDGCVVVLNREHPLAALPRLTLRNLADLRLAWNPKRDRFFVYRDICKYFSSTGIIHIPEQENLLRLISMERGMAAVLPRSALRAPGDWNRRLRGMDVEDFPMPGRIWLIYPRQPRSSERVVMEAVRRILDEEDLNSERSLDESRSA